MNTDDRPTDVDVLAAFPTSAIDEDNVEHYRGRLVRRLMINQCTNCTAWHHPPRHFCPQCWSPDVAPVEVHGEGVVELWTSLHVGTPKPDIDYATGHVLAAVRLDQAPGVRFTAPLRGIAVGVDPIGSRVRLSWADRDGAPLPVFVPAHGAS